jgi:hypothetical protein
MNMSEIQPNNKNNGYAEKTFSILE